MIAVENGVASGKDGVGNGPDDISTHGDKQQPFANRSGVAQDGKGNIPAGSPELFQQRHLAQEAGRADPQWPQQIAATRCQHVTGNMGGHAKRHGHREPIVFLRGKERDERSDGKSQNPRKFAHGVGNDLQGLRRKRGQEYGKYSGTRVDGAKIWQLDPPHACERGDGDENSQAKD